jgi:hypothetical protein
VYKCAIAGEASAGLLALSFQVARRAWVLDTGAGSALDGHCTRRWPKGFGEGERGNSTPDGAGGAVLRQSGR